MVGDPIRAIQVVGDVATIVGHDAVYSVSLKSGELRWTSELPKGAHSSAYLLVDRESVYVVTQAKKDWFIEYEAESGHKRRQFRLEKASPFVVRDGILFTQWKHREFAAISIATRTACWRREVPYNYGRDVAPHLWNDLLLFGTEKEILAADARTGEVRWRSPGESVALDGVFGDVVVVHDRAGITGLNVETGAVRWQVAAKRVDKSYAHADRVAFELRKGVLVLDPRNGETIFRHRSRGIPKGLKRLDDNNPGHPSWQGENLMVDDRGGHGAGWHGESALAIFLAP